MIGGVSTTYLSTKKNPGISRVLVIHNIYGSLFHNQHLTGFVYRGGAEFIQIYSAGAAVAMLVQAIPMNLLVAFVYIENPHQASLAVIDAYGAMVTGFHIHLETGAGFEGIGICIAQLV